MNFSQRLSYKQIRGDGFINATNRTPDRMVTLLITSVLIVGLFAIAIYFWQKPSNNLQSMDLPPANPPRALFSDSLSIAELPEPENGGNEEILLRATNGDLSVLVDAKARGLYDNVLNTVLSQASSESKLLSLASYIARHNLPVNRALAEAMINSWQVSPNRQTTAKMLHFAALSDDAETYRRAVELAVAFWGDGKLQDLSATELQALFNSEFWLLSAGVRGSGSGFILKRTLSSARRELEGTTNN